MDLLLSVLVIWAVLLATFCGYIGLAYAISVRKERATQEEQLMDAAEATAHIARASQYSTKISVPVQRTSSRSEA